MLQGTSWHCRSPGNPPVGSRCPWYSCNAGSAGGRSVPLSHTLAQGRGKLCRDCGDGGDTRGTAERRRSGSGARSRPPQHRNPGRPTERPSRPTATVWAAPRLCSARRTAPNFTRALPSCRSRQVVHNARQTRKRIFWQTKPQGRSLPSSAASKPWTGY